MYWNAECLPQAIGAAVVAALSAAAVADKPEFCVDKTRSATTSIASEPADCRGDSGHATLTKRADGRWTQVGIVGYGALALQKREELGLTARPSLYVDVRHRDTWSRSAISSGN
jgi:hypothetical protein